MIAILEAIDAEPWAEALYLGDLYLPSLRRIPPGQLASTAEAAAASLLASPREYFERVLCPTLALFGEDDLNVPVARSVELLKEYFATAENADLSIIVFPEAGHSLNDFMPAYWEAIDAWFETLRALWECRGD